MARTELRTNSEQRSSTRKELPHIVIIGGGFAGLKAALHLRKAKCRITLIDRSNHHLFQPLLYQVATAGLSPGEIAAPIRGVVRKQRNTEVLMAEVTGVDRAKKHVLLSNGCTVPYDYLIIATGARHSYFGHDEWEKFAPGLKSIADATRIRREILMAYEAAELESDDEKRKSMLTVIIVGAGPTGCEMAGSIAELAHKAMRKDFRNFSPDQTRVLLVEAGPKILSAFPDELGKAAERELKRLGVEVMTNTKVENIDANGVTMNGKRVQAKTIVWAAGVKASPASEWLGIKGDRAGRVPVDEFLRAQGCEDIFVLGDTALALDRDKSPLPGVAAVAMQQGTYIGQYLTAKLAGRNPVRPFKYVDKGSMATIGRAFAIAKIWKFRIAGFFAWMVWLFVHVMYLIGFRNRLLVLTQWAWAYMSYQRGVRLIVEPEPSPRILSPLDGLPKQNGVGQRPAVAAH